MQIIMPCYEVSQAGEHGQQAAISLDMFKGCVWRAIMITVLVQQICEEMYEEVRRDFTLRAIRSRPEAAPPLVLTTKYLDSSVELLGHRSQCQGLILVIS